MTKDCALLLSTRREQSAKENDYREDVNGINSRYAFRLSRRSADAKWSVALIVDLQKEKLPPDDSGMGFRFAQRRWGFTPPVLHVERESLESIVKSPTFVVQRCRPVKVGGEELVEIAFTLSHDAAEVVKNQVIDQGVMVLDPARYWCLRRFEGRARAGEAVGKLRLEVSDFQDLPGRVPVPRRKAKEEEWQIQGVTHRGASTTVVSSVRPQAIFFRESSRRARKHTGMAAAVTHDPQEWELIRRAGAGDSSCLHELFTRYRSRLKQMVRLRLDPRVRGRVDPSDVIQEACLEVSRKLADYVANPSLPFFLWLRLTTGQKLALAHRQHLGVQARNAGREVSLHRGPYPAASSEMLAAKLMGKLTSPSQAAIKAEVKIRLEQALNRMDALDREVLTLRHFEQLSNAETALVLGIKENTACNRYVRALERLRGVLAKMPGGIGGL